MERNSKGWYKDCLQKIIVQPNLASHGASFHYYTLPECAHGQVVAWCSETDGRIVSYIIAQFHINHQQA